MRRYVAARLAQSALVVLLSLSGAVVWTSRGAGEEPSAT